MNIRCFVIAGVVLAGWQISDASAAEQPKADVKPADIVPLDAATTPLMPGAVSPEMRVPGYDGRYMMSEGYTSNDGKFVAGLWLSGPGGIKTDGFSRDEYFLIVSGELETTSSNGHRRSFHAGDSFVIPKGWVGVWTMKTKLSVQYAFYEQKSQ